MKVIHIVSGMDLKAGGVTQAVLSIGEGLQAQGVDNEIVCLESDDKQMQYLPFTTHRQGPAKTPWKYGKNLIPWLRQNWERFDAVIVHGLWQYHTYAAYQVWKEKDKSKPIYVMPHGMLDPYFQKAKGRRLKAIRNWLFWKLVERNIVNNATALLFTCETERLLARETFTPYRPPLEVVVGLGVEAPPLYESGMTVAFSEKAGLASEEPYLLYLSRIHPKKGLDMLVKAYLKIKQKDPTFPKLVIAGPGIETDFGQKVVSLIGQSEDVHLVGMLTGDAKWGALYGCEAFVLPSHQENFGIAVVEALACGKPVLISDQVNIWREIADGEAGLVAKDTVEGSRHLLIEWVLLTAEQKSKMAEQTKKVYAQYFSIEKSASNVKALIEQNFETRATAV